MTTIPPDSGPSERLTPEHARYLANHAVNVDMAVERGVYSAQKVDDLPDEWRKGIGRRLPGIVFPWTSANGRTSIQLRPDEPGTDSNGDPVKYVFQSDVEPVLWPVRTNPEASRVLIVEGSKQCLVAAEHAPDDYEVYGIAGCWGWSHDNTPISDLEVVQDRRVVVLFDADAGTNHQVYTAGTRLHEALLAEGANEVRWARLPAGKKAGLDDVLAKRSPDRRSDYLSRIVSGAKAKVADSKPKPGKEPPKKPEPSDGRPVVEVDNDRLKVITQITNALIDKWDGTELFNHGGVISELDKTTMRPVDKGVFNNLVMQATMPVIVGMNGITHTWPDPNTVLAILSAADKFTPLDRITRVPFLRPDGSVVTQAGYDEATRTLLIPSDDLEGVDTPDTPTPEQVATARDFILDEWLGDMPFPDNSSKANALAMVLTPFVRGLVPLVPLAVIDGLQMGVGKNLLADCLSILVTGYAADPKPYTSDDTEHRKVLTSAFRTGDEMFVFDEAHTLEGANFARAITSVTYSDRILGVSTMAEFPNRVTWLALGNQVQVQGDMTRRVYRIALHPPYANPMDRSVDTFRHPELREWTGENRAELFTAALTLVKAWFCAGEPPAPRSKSFGSFEKWQKIIGGVLHHAEVPGFLENLFEWRSESDYDSHYWVAHMMWLHETFGDIHFTTSQVKSEAQRDVDGYESPPGMEETSTKQYTRELGKAYGKLKGRSYEGYRIIKVGVAHKKTIKWAIRRDSDDSLPPTGGSGGNGGGSHSLRVGETSLDVGHHAYTCFHGGEGCEPTSLTSVTSTTPIVLDLETGDADKLHSYGPGFVRLAGWDAGSGAKPGAVDDLITAIRSSTGPIVGHNVLGFDLPALVREEKLDADEITELADDDRVYDTLLSARQDDPPMAKDKGVDAVRKLDLDSLGARFSLGGKAGDLQALAKRHGGLDAIPVEDLEYCAYLTGDVDLTRKLYFHQGPAEDDYLKREHRVAALAARISLNGFRVDTAELANRVRAGSEGKSEALKALAGRGLPTHDSKGRESKSPLSTKAGKQALERMLTDAGATSLWRTTKTGELDVSADAMDRLIGDYEDYYLFSDVPNIAWLVRQVVKTRTVYQTITDHLVGDRVHPSISFAQATGRWSVTKPGLTVLGKHNGLHIERDIFLPEKGELLVAVDLSQVDMRAIAGLSGDTAYVDMLSSEDPHTEIATALFGDASRRHDAKAIGHGWNYGRGLKAISESEEIAPEVVKTFDESMRNRFPRLVEWRDEVREKAAAGELLDNGFGRRMRPDPKRAHTQGPALMGQGAARDIMMQGLLNLPRRVIPMLRAQIHDEVVLSVPKDEVDEVTRTVVDAFTFEWKNGVPIVAEASPPASTWGRCYSKG